MCWGKIRGVAVWNSCQKEQKVVLTKDNLRRWALLRASVKLGTTDGQATPGLAVCFALTGPG